jgi:hypothetical protein
MLRLPVPFPAAPPEICLPCACRLELGSPLCRTLPSLRRCCPHIELLLAAHVARLQPPPPPRRPWNIPHPVPISPPPPTPFRPLSCSCRPCVSRKCCDD